MNSLYKNLFIISCFITLMTGCNNQMSIKSATSDKVVIAGQPEKFTDTYQMANKECKKYSKTAEYIIDETADLSVIAFNCAGEEVEVETRTEEAPTETGTESQTEMEEVSTE